MARQDRERRRRLNRMMKDLQNVPPSEILPYLTCLSRIRVEVVRAREKNVGSTIAAAELFEELPKREGWYSDLINALREIERDTLADTLEGPERQSSSGSSQGGASGMSFQSAQTNQVKSRQQSTPANPAGYAQQPQGQLGRPPEPEASFTPVKPEEKDVQCKGEQEVKKSFGEDPEQRPPPPPAELPLSIQEGIPDAPAPRHQSRMTHRGSPAPSGPDRDQQRYDSESDSSNTSPPQGGHSSRVTRGMTGKAEESVVKMMASNPSSKRDTSPSCEQQWHNDSESDTCNTSPSNTSPPEAEASVAKMLPRSSRLPGKDAGLDGVSVNPRHEGLAGNEAAPGRVKEDIEIGRDEEKKRVEGKKDEEEWNNQNTTNHMKHLNVSKPSNIPGKLNNLSPTKPSGQSPNVEVGEEDLNVEMGNIERLSSGTHSLSSCGIDPRNKEAVDSLTESQLLISKSLTASSQSGSCLQQNNDGNKESLGGAHKAGSKDGGRGGSDPVGAIKGGAAAPNGEVPGDGEVPCMVDASNGNQDSLIMRMGSVVRGYVPAVLNSLSDRILNP
ncbi:uncharacterized protein LOC121424954 [Lytechinus variegatus]|uniref:uncharacterized protein LOC121424954 n=1 Tax=Lytechinus variegatus TaxID=7654 RepID=UPI001BB183BD|nr:uncharacterized protein LOC121424954 [Lytechinus variegatus]